MHRLMILLVLPLAITACSWDIENIDIQEDYVDHRDKCQDVAEKKMALFTKNAAAMPEQQKKAQLFNLFKGCMQNQGWGLGKDPAAPPPTNAQVIGEPGWRKFGYGVNTQPQQQPISAPQPLMGAPTQDTLPPPGQPAIGVNPPSAPHSLPSH